MKNGKLENAKRSTSESIDRRSSLFKAGVRTSSDNTGIMVTPLRERATHAVQYLAAIEVLNEVIREIPALDQSERNIPIQFLRSGSNRRSIASKPHALGQ